MKKKRLSRSGFLKPSVLFGLGLGCVGIFLGLSAFGISSGASALTPGSREGGNFLVASAKIAPEVLADTTGGKNGSIVIFLTEQADLSVAYRMKDQDARGWFVYNTLTEHAARTQADLQAFLIARGVGFQSFWGANMIVATGDRSLVDSLAARTDVARIDSNRPAHWIEEPSVATFAITPNASDVPRAPEWGVTNVNAPSVWGLGFT